MCDLCDMEGFSVGQSSKTHLGEVIKATPKELAQVPLEVKEIPDLSYEDVVDVLRFGWGKVATRTERDLLRQLGKLLLVSEINKSVVKK